MNLCAGALLLDGAVGHGRRGRPGVRLGRELDREGDAGVLVGAARAVRRPAVGREQSERLRGRRRLGRGRGGRRSCCGFWLADAYVVVVVVVVVVVWPWTR